MKARFHDGVTARPHAVQVSVEADTLRFEAGDRAYAWPLADVEAEIEEDQARLSCPIDPDARLIASAEAWTGILGSSDDARKISRRRKEIGLVAGLTAFAAATALFVFVGVPALSGPLARATPVGMERRMGESFEAQLSGLFQTCTADADGQAVVARLGDRIASQADTPFDIRVRAVQAPMVNALALPGGVVMVTDDLIREAKSADELAAVISHEVAHVEQRHVMQAVWRSLGIGMILDAVVGGGSGAGQQAVIQAGNLTDLSYGRAAEREADARGQALLHAGGLSSRGMASFFARLGRSSGREELDRTAEFLATHPDTALRARAAKDRERPGAPALTAAEWASVRQACRTDDYLVVRDVRRRLGRN